MNTTIQKIFRILIIGLAAILCLLLPKIWGTGQTTPILIGSYSFLLLVSFFERKSNNAFAFILLASLLPISEIIWYGFRDTESWDWYHIEHYVQNNILAFSFAGFVSYFIVCLIIPAMVLLIGDVVRKHRDQKAQQQQSH